MEAVQWKYSYQVRQVVSLALGSCAYRLDVVQQLACAVQHLFLVALQ